MLKALKPIKENTVATSSPEMKQAGYMLPAEMVHDIKRVAAEHDVWPARIVERAVREYLAKASNRKRQTA